MSSVEKRESPIRLNPEAILAFYIAKTAPWKAWRREQDAVIELDRLIHERKVSQQ